MRTIDFFFYSNYTFSTCILNITLDGASVISAEQVYQTINLKMYQTINLNSLLNN